MTSKEYLINCRILFKYFELVFLQLQLVKILCKLISIRVNYKKNKKGSFLWNTVYICATNSLKFGLWTCHSADQIMGYCSDLTHCGFKTTFSSPQLEAVVHHCQCTETGLQSIRHSL